MSSSLNSSSNSIHSVGVDTTFLLRNTSRFLPSRYSTDQLYTKDLKIETTKQGREPITSRRKVRRYMQVLDMAQESARRHEVIRLKEEA